MSMEVQEAKHSWGELNLRLQHLTSHIVVEYMRQVGPHMFYYSLPGS